MTATPGLADGCAAGDVVRVANDGTFVVMQRGGNLGVQVIAPAETDQTSFASLTAAIERLGGHLDGGSVVKFARGEELRREISAKFTPDQVAADLEAASLSLEEWFTDPDDLFALSVARPS